MASGAEDAEAIDCVRETVVPAWAARRCWTRIHRRPPVPDARATVTALECRRRRINVDGRLEIDVAGERWKPVPALADCGPEDPCYVVRVDSDGLATIRFGDGVHGRPLPHGAQVQATYRSGSGSTGDRAEGRSDDLAVTLMELLAYVGDRLVEMQDRVATEAYLETARERSSLPDIAGLRAVIAERPGDVQICLCFRPLGPPAETPGNVTPWRPSAGS